MNPFEAPNLSEAWAKLFLHCMVPGVHDVSPVVLTTQGVSVDAVQENQLVRVLLNDALAGQGASSIDTVASTIFPYSLWNRSLPRVRLYERFGTVWPRVRKCRANMRGTYFQRFVAFGLEPKQPLNSEGTVNQLEHIIDTWVNHGNHRHSALQLSVFDPMRDHQHNRQLGFPCLHQVAFNPVGANGKDGLEVTGFYATQHAFEKGYGNYLGLCRLGQFVAHELGIPFVRMTCIAAVGKLGNTRKSELSSLADALTKIIA